MLEGGVDAPRKKTRDSDPISQFILTYRKLFGLTQYIGLAFSDRFELSGDELEEWLFNPANGKTILMRNLGGALTPEEATPTTPATFDRPLSAAQMELLVDSTSEDQPMDVKSPYDVHSLPGWSTLDSRVRNVRAIDSTDILRSMQIDTCFLGLGFEERCLASTQRLFDTLGSVRKAVMVRYTERGFGTQIEEIVRSKSEIVEIVEYSDLSKDILKFGNGPIVIDVTGLAKPAIFFGVRHALHHGKSVLVAHTDALAHYPNDKDIARVFDSVDSDDVYKTLESAGRVWSGENTPYSFVRLLASDVDDSRQCLLCSAVSAKHERLLTLMEERDYDAVDILAPNSQSNRGKLARLAADVATRGIESSQISEVDSNDLTGILSFLTDRFRTYYLKEGYGVEFGLTGSKMHAVACAIASTSFKIAQIWYVSPARFDPNRFLITTQAKRNLSSRSGIGGVRSAT